MQDFQYQAFSSPYAASIADEIARAGDAHARAAEVISRAQARAAEVRGQAWGGATQAIGQAVAGAAQQMTDPRAQLEREQLATVRRATHSREVFETELKNPANYTADGTVDDAKLTERLKQQDVGAWEHWTAISAANQKNALELREKYQTILKTGGEIEAQRRTAQHAQADYLGKLAYHATDLLQQKPDDALHARDTVLASVARAAVDGAISEPDAKQFLMQTAHATPEQLRQVFASFVPPELAAKLDKEKADTAKANADAAKATAEANNLATFGPKRTDTEAALDAYAKSIGKTRAEDLTAAERQAYDTQQGKIKADQAYAQHQRERDYDNAHPTPVKDKSQDALEQEYRTVLARGLSSRSGGLGLEDSKVQQANHLLALLDQTYDPKTGAYTIPKVLQGELAAGLARLVAPGGNVGIEMMREFDQRTAKGDLAGALSYITGHPFPTATQDVAKMLKDSIERQGKVALENREGEMRYLRGLAPTDLAEDRRTKLEATSLNPLRQSRVIQNTNTGERKLQVSLDGGATWK